MVKLIKTEKLTFRPGWDVTIELINETKKENITFYWPRKEQPDEKILADKFKYLETQFNEAESAPVKTYSQTDIDNILKEKKYLTGDQHFPSDLPIKITAIGGV